MVGRFSVAGILSLSLPFAFFLFFSAPSYVSSCAFIPAIQTNTITWDFVVIRYCSHLSAAPIANYHNNLSFYLSLTLSLSLSISLYSMCSLYQLVYTQSLLTSPLSHRYRPASLLQLIFHGFGNAPRVQVIWHANCQHQFPHRARFSVNRPPGDCGRVGYFLHWKCIHFRLEWRH